MRKLDDKAIAKIQKEYERWQEVFEVGSFDSPEAARKKHYAQGRMHGIETAMFLLGVHMS